MSDLSSSESDNEDCKISSGDQASGSDGSKNEDEPVIKHCRIDESTVKKSAIST